MVDVLEAEGEGAVAELGAVLGRRKKVRTKVRPFRRTSAVAERRGS